MSQESEDYITPMFPQNAEEEVEEVEVEDDDFTLVGGANRRLWPTVDAYKTKFLNMFQNGYMSGITKTTYLPPLSLSDLVPNVEVGAAPNKQGKLPQGNSKSTTFDNIRGKDYNPKAGRVTGYEIKELKKEDDFANYPNIFGKATRTTPVFYLSVFLTKALQKALELEATPAPDASNAAAVESLTKLKNEMMLFVEIVVSLCILSYINILT